MKLFNHSALLLSLWLGAVSQGRLHSAEPGKAVDRFNYVLGTQTIGAKYHFTDKTPLVETADVIEAMGATVIKFDLSRGSKKERESRPNIHSLMELARDEPSHRKVLDMPFAHMVLWMGTFSQSDWHKGFPQAAQEAVYREVYELVCYLLKTYSGSEKNFYLGHWEGDGMLRHSIKKEDDVRVTPEAVQGMIDWLNVRQSAVDAAKRDTPHHRVQVWHYTEVNHVVLAKDAGRPALVNMVLPYVPVDFVSYSAYDTTNKAKPEDIKSALDYIETKLTPKPEISGKRVFIGEYGYPIENDKGRLRTPEAQEALSRIPMRVGLEWGCRFVLYWELYNNELTSAGHHVGYWMIDDKGVKQPVFQTHCDYYKWARQFVGDAIAKTGKAPEDGEFRKAAAAYLK